MGVRHWPSPRPWPNASMPSTPDVCVKFCQYHTPGILLQMRQFGASQAVRQSLKGKMLSAEVLRAPGSVSPGGRPSPCRVRRTATAIWLEETRGASKNHLAGNDRRWPSPRTLESARRGGRQGTGRSGNNCRQYGNALSGVRYQEEEGFSDTSQHLPAWNLVWDL